MLKKALLFIVLLCVAAGLAPVFAEDPFAINDSGLLIGRDLPENSVTLQLTLDQKKIWAKVIEGKFNYNRDVALTGSILNFDNAGKWSWCPGTKHVWLGKIEYKKYIFDSEPTSPLTFEVLKEKYLYLSGQGTVTLPNGNVVALPQNSPVKSGVSQKTSTNGVSLSNPSDKEADELSKILPPFKLELKGDNEIRINNPNDFSVAVGVRKGVLGKDLFVPRNSVKSLYVPDGQYDIYFVYSNNPSALMQGDGFTLQGNGVLIKIVSVVGGNYNIKRVNY